jgi:hypothetical protein
MMGDSEGSIAAGASIRRAIGALGTIGVERAKGLVAPIGQKMTFARIFGGAPKKDAHAGSAADAGSVCHRSTSAFPFLFL